MAPTLIDIAIERAARAPSAHNTQPWQVSREGNSVLAQVDPHRTLPQADPTGQDTMLGMGCWVESLAIALGSAVDVAVTGQAPLISVKVTPVTGTAPEFTVAELTRRQVDRGKLLPDTPALSAASAELSRMESSSTLIRLAEPTWRRAHNATALDIARDREVLQETLDWLRLTPSHPGYHRDGLNAHCLRLPLALGNLGDKLLGGKITRKLVIANAHHWQPVASQLYYSRARNPPARLALAAPGKTGPTETVELGRELLRCWLVLGRHGLNVAVNSEIKDNPTTADTLPAGTFAVFSAGRSTGAVPRSARLPSGGDLRRSGGDKQRG